MSKYYNYKTQELFQPDKIIITRVYRTGVQSLWVKNYKFYVSIYNRTYFSCVNIPLNKVTEWITKFNTDQ